MRPLILNPTYEDTGRQHPTFVHGGRVGILLIHGFTGTPFETRGIAERFIERGFTVANVALLGHGSSPEPIQDTRWPNWWQSVLAEYRRLSEHVDEVFVCGVSMGGALGLYLASQFRISGLMTLAAPVLLSRRVRMVAPVLAPWVPVLAKGASDIGDAAARARHPQEDVLPLRGVRSLLRFLKLLRPRLVDVRCPILILQGARDQTVPPGNARLIHEGVSSIDKSLTMFPNSHHLLSVDRDAEQVIHEVLTFVQGRVSDTNRA